MGNWDDFDDNRDDLGVFGMFDLDRDGHLDFREKFIASEWLTGHELDKDEDFSEDFYEKSPWDPDIEDCMLPEDDDEDEYTDDYNRYGYDKEDYYGDSGNTEDSGDYTDFYSLEDF